MRWIQVLSPTALDDEYKKDGKLKNLANVFTFKCRDIITKNTQNFSPFPR